MLPFNREPMTMSCWFKITLLPQGRKRYGGGGGCTVVKRKETYFNCTFKAPPQKNWNFFLPMGPPPTVPKIFVVCGGDTTNRATNIKLQYH
ncbi:hypothetical protein FKM82_004089 [Ascaphus truei]